MKVSPYRVNRLASVIAAPAIVLGAVIAAPTHGGGLQSELEHAFNDMVHITKPGVHETQRRGVLSGGRMTVKTKIFNESLVAFTPPGYKASCGGIDLYGGSFSFINSDQIVQLLRSVAANAKGYFFQIALDTVSPEISSVIENFQKKVQQLNQYLGNSCQLAQGLVNDTMSAVTNKTNEEISLMGTLSGIKDDMFSATQEQDGHSTNAAVRANARDEYEDKIIGNVLWKELQTNQAASWFRYGGPELLEVIMSITGTVIVADITDDHAGNKTNPVRVLPGGKVTISHLVNGGEMETYHCTDTSLCMDAGMATGGQRTITIKGIAQKLIDELTGTATNPGGIIRKYSQNQGGLQASESALLRSLPASAGSIIRNLSALSPQAAEQFVEESSSALALVMSYGMIMDFMKAARASVSVSNSPHRKEVIDQINESIAMVRSDYSVLMSQYGDISSIMERYNALIMNTRKQKYLLQEANTPSQTGR